MKIKLTFWYFYQLLKFKLGLSSWRPYRPTKEFEHLFAPDKARYKRIGTHLTIRKTAADEIKGDQ